MANEQTSVPLFAASEVLTAANMNISAGTGVPVFSNSTTRDAGFGGANEKVLAEGQLCYLSSTNIVQYYDGAAWATVGPASAGGLVYITQATPSAVNSVSINDCFSSTYQNYRIIFTPTTSVGVNSYISLRYRVSSTDTITGYKYVEINSDGSSVSTSVDSQGTTLMVVGFLDPTSKGMAYWLEIQDPNQAQKTKCNIASQNYSAAGAYALRSFAGAQADTTQFTGITFTTSGTSFTGTIRVYGYANS
jgi:hypothetical protein